MDEIYVVLRLVFPMPVAQNIIHHLVDLCVNDLRKLLIGKSGLPLADYRRFVYVEEPNDDALDTSKVMTIID